MDQIILGVKIDNFSQQSLDVQRIFCEFGCAIRTRVGLHSVHEGVCSPQGIIVVEFIGGIEKADEMSEKLSQLEGVVVQRMVF